MSLLLEALKKAALDKQQREHQPTTSQTSGQQESPEDNAPTDASASEEPIQSAIVATEEEADKSEFLPADYELPQEFDLLPENQDEGSTSLDDQLVNLDQPTLELASSNEPENISAQENVDSAASGNHAEEEFSEEYQALDSAQQNIATDNTDDNQQESHNPEKETRGENTAHSNESNSDHSSTNSLPVADVAPPPVNKSNTSNKQAADHEHASSETASENPPKPSASQPAASPIEASLEKDRKAAMAHLLNNTQKSAKRARTRFLILLTVLTTLALLLIGLYFSFIYRGKVQQPMMTQHTPQAMPQTASSNAIAATDHELEENSDINHDASATAVPTENTTDSSGSNLAQIDPPSTPTKDTPTRVTAKPKAVKTQKKSFQATLNNDKNTIKQDVPAEDPLFIAIQQGYEAYQKGLLDHAEIAYRKALSLSPNHRDALLGAAAVSAKKGNVNQALGLYQQRLTQAPKDDYALAGLLALAQRNNQDSGLLTEVDLLLEEFPQAAHLYFLKGALLSQMNQWQAAQNAFFDAWRWDNSHPDYAYNLAVALDHLREFNQAKDLYQTAIRLAQTRASSFSPETVLQRIQQLENKTQ